MSLKWFFPSSKETAEAAINEAIRKLSEVKGELNMSGTKVETLYGGGGGAAVLSPTECCGQGQTPAPKSVNPVEVGQGPAPYEWRKFVPKKDITAFELATIFNAWAAQIMLTEKAHNSLDYNAQRHFKLTSENPYD